MKPLRRSGGKHRSVADGRPSRSAYARAEREKDELNSLNEELASVKSELKSLQENFRRELKDAVGLGT